MTPPIEIIRLPTVEAEIYEREIGYLVQVIPAQHNRLTLKAAQELAIDLAKRGQFVGIYKVQSTYEGQVKRPAAHLPLLDQTSVQPDTQHLSGTEHSR